MRVDFPSLLRPYITMKLEALDSKVVCKTACSLILSTNFIISDFVITNCEITKKKYCDYTSLNIYMENLKQHHYSFG